MMPSTQPTEPSGRQGAIWGHLRRGRVLYLAQVDVLAKNGNLQRHQQLVTWLAREFPGRFDLLSLASSPRRVRKWLQNIQVEAQVLDGAFATAARLNARLWYLANVVACHKLRWSRAFRFPLVTPLPASLRDRYDYLFCFYAWPYLLMRLSDVGTRAVVDLNDIMAERHQRIGAREWINLTVQQEASIIQGPATCLAITEDDRAEVERLYGTGPSVVPFVPAGCEALLAVHGAPRSRRVGYLAARAYANLRVISALSQAALLERLREAGVTLVLAGGICRALDPATVQRLRASGVEVAGVVDRIEDFYRGVSVVLNPVGPSTGVKVKSVEALLAGRALVTTEFGVDSALRRFFPRQISLVSWPLAPSEMADAIVAALGATEGTGMSPEDAQSGAARYVASARDALAQVLRK
jgi:hypothetical protein